MKFWLNSLNYLLNKKNNYYQIFKVLFILWKIISDKTRFLSFSQIKVKFEI